MRPVLGGGITWAAGRAPTLLGEIRVRWEEVDQQVRVHVSAPPGTTGSVAVPLVNGSASLSLDGQIIYDKSRAIQRAGIEIHDRYVVVAVDGGYHEFLVS